MTEQIISPIEKVVVLKESEFQALQEKAARLDKFLDMERWEQPAKMLTTVDHCIIHLATDEEWVEQNRHSKGKMGERLRFFQKSLADLLFPDCRLY
ncbi:MAG: hypothetical protein AB8B69_16965 [Chitinophagales bacterium]